MGTIAACIWRCLVVSHCIVQTLHVLTHNHLVAGVLFFYTKQASS